MSEPLDFDAIARRLFAERQPDGIETAVAATLRDIWNTRGAADRATIERELSSQMGSTAAGPYVKNLDRALQALDR